MSQGDGFRSNPATTGASPMFVSSAEEILTILGDDASPEAKALRAQAVELARFFASWPTARPGPDERFSAIQRVMDVTRDALELAAKRPGSPSGRGHR